MTAIVRCCATCWRPGSGLGGHCIFCRATRLAVDQFAGELAADLRQRERLAHQCGLGDSTRLLTAMRDLLAGRRPEAPR